jgi:hypothetical protein
VLRNRQQSGEAINEKRYLKDIFMISLFAFQISFLSLTARAATLSLDGSRTFQTMDGVGVNINSLSWMNGESKPAIDRLADEMGCTVWRVVFDMEDWENPNDNADPATPDWTYYNALYSNAKFQNLWGTLAYLESKGFTNTIALSFMGRVPTWMGGSSINSTAEDEWVEMMATLMYYARNTRGLQFKILDPLNETDWDGIEGPQVNATQYVRLLRKLSLRLDAMGLTDVRFLGPNTASVSTGVNTYIPAMRNDAVVNARVDHFGLHDYGGGTGGAATALQGSGKNFWMTENADPAQMMNMLSQNANAVLLWEGFDSVYNHAILAGRGTTPPNDDPGINLPPLSYSTTNKTYAARPLLFQYESVFKFVPPGAVRINTTDSAANVTLYAFTQPSTGRVTIIGQNTGSATSMTTTMTGLPGINTFEFYQATNNSFQKNADLPVSGASFTFTAPANAFFTLTGVPGGTSSGKTFYIRDGGTSTACSDWTNACDSLPATLQRGATYYIADGAYASQSMNTPVSGTQTITLKKATIADHGTATGWSDAYGDGIANFSGQMEFTTRYWILDGQTGGGPSGWTSGFGFKVTETASTPVIFINGGGDVAVRHVEIQGAGDNGAPGDRGNDSFQVLGGNGSVSLSYAYLHDAGRCHFYFNGNTGASLLAEYVYLGKYESTASEHSEAVVLHSASTLFTLRWSVITHEEGTGAIIAGDSGAPTAEIYGNVFYDASEFGPWGSGNNGLIATDSAGHSLNWKVYNNTFINLPANLATFGSAGTQTGNVASNNYFYNSPSHDASAWGTESFDHFQNSGGVTGANGTTGTGNPFVDLANYNFHLLQASPAGQALAAPYNIDMFGIVRGADGLWDRGALEFVGSQPSACDLNGDLSTNVSDVQQCVNQAIGTAACSTGDITKDGTCNVVDVQRTVNAALGGPCVIQ